jgi:aryl-alcohol dehydrogenase-like predicted oxidoreductase
MKPSQIALGTANFGLQYGVKNQRQLSLKEVKQILDACSASGVATFDTAIGYGESQRVLGSAGCHGLDCITKLPGLPAQVGDIAEWVHSQVAQARLDLRQESLYGLLLHRPGDLLGPHGPELAKAMHLAQEEFNIQKLGISVYEPQELLDCWKVLQYDLVQLPCNVFDQRFTTGPAVAHLRSRNIEVHARSVFLQGLLLMPDISRPAYFNPWAHVFEAWHTLVETSKKTPLEVCLAFANQQRFVDKWVIGVDSEDQLLGILSASDLGEFVIPDTAWAPFKDLPLALISPAQWSLQ